MKQSLPRGSTSAPVSWDDLQLLLEVDRRGSFLAAGRALGLATSTVSRRLDDLEARLATTLVHRRATGVSLRDGARPLVEVAQAMASRVDAAVRSLRDDSGRLGGTVRVALGPGFVPIVAPAIAAFRRVHAQVAVELMSETRTVDLARREADIAVRAARTHGASVVLQGVGELRYALFGSRTRSPGRARSARERLSSEGVIGYAPPLHRIAPMAWLREHGVTRFAVRANTTEGVLALALAGEGLATLPIVVASPLRDLERVDGLGIISGPTVHVAMHREARARPAVAALAADISDALRRALGRAE